MIRPANHHGNIFYGGLASRAVAASSHKNSKTRGENMEFSNHMPNARPEWRGAEGVEMLTGRAIPRPLQADGWANDLWQSYQAVSMVTLADQSDHEGVDGV